MSTNLQPISLGLIAIQPYYDFISEEETGPLLQNEFGEQYLQDDAFVNPPSVFVDGILLTYSYVLDRRYIVHDPEAKTITIKNAKINDGEIVQVFL